MKVGDHKGAYIRFDVAEGRLCFMLKTSKESRDYILLKIVARECMNDLFPVSRAQIFVAFTHDVQANTLIHKSDFILFMFGHAYGCMQGYGIPDQL